MSTGNISNSPTSAPTESKSARKKKAKAEAAAAAAAAVSPATPIKDPQTPGEDSQNGVEDSEHPYIRELQKKLRNVNKKLNAMEKVNSVVKENPGVSLDDLVASKKINNDQKAQALKKPQLEIDREQIEESLSHYKKVNEDYQQKIARQKEVIEAGHTEKVKELEKTIRAEEEAEADKALKQRLLVFSQFLRAAAARRQQGDDDSELSKAFEGALLQVYGGNSEAVEAAEKLINGSEDHVMSTEGLELTVSYAQVKQASIEDAPFAAEEAWVEEVAQSHPAPPDADDNTVVPTTDPTVANAGLTELAVTAPATNGEAEVAEVSAPPAASIDDGAANAAGAEQWDTKVPGSDDPLAESFEMVPRDPAETEATHEPAPAASTQSWAEDTATVETPVAPESTPATTHGDGFQEVPHSRGGRGRGGFQGERRGYRGRGGPRGEGRGRGGRGSDRGRGGFRGGRGRDNAQQAQPSQ